MTAPVTPLVTPGQLDFLLGLNGEIDEDRATFILGQVESLARDVVDPLPTSATAIILRVAAYAYDNPTGATGDTSGDRTKMYAALQALSLTKADRRDLRRAAGKGGGAFSVDITATDAGTIIPGWDQDEGYNSPDVDQSSPYAPAGPWT